MIDAARQTWPAFVLVAGLLRVGAVAEADGLFAAVGARLARLPCGPRVLLLALLGLVAVFMSNAALLVLPGPNLTNLVVLANEHVAGATYAARTLPGLIARCEALLAATA